MDGSVPVRMSAGGRIYPVTNGEELIYVANKIQNPDCVMFMHDPDPSAPLCRDGTVKASRYTGLL